MIRVIFSRRDSPQAQAFCRRPRSPLSWDGGNLGHHKGPRSEQFMVAKDENETLPGPYLEIPEGQPGGVHVTLEPAIDDLLDLEAPSPPLEFHGFLGFSIFVPRLHGDAFKFHG